MNTEENKDEIKEEQVEQNATAEENNDENSSESENNAEELSELEKKTIEYNELHEKFIRLYSEFDNYRKRTAKEKIEITKTAAERVMKDILPTLDDFQRAIDHNEKLEDLSAMREGFQLIENKLFKSLEKQGLKQMESKGETFDAEKHEAITNIPAPSDDMKGKIVDVIERGYTLNDKIIRFPKVVVGQ